MRIAQVAPLYESVPPLAYGGTERVVSYLTEELVRQGHQVTLFASGDSNTAANLVAICPRALRLDPNSVDQLAPHLQLVEEVYRRAHQFDLIHFHIDYLHFSLSHRLSHPQVTTLHGRLDIPELPALHRVYPDMPMISISNAQRKPLPWLNWQGTVYHGMPSNVCEFHERGGDYLAFLGRTSPEKGLDEAIAIARRCGRKLKIAAKVDKVDQDYFAARIKPLLAADDVEFIGEVGGKAKCDFLGNAASLLFPIDWPEPFGLVMIEAMACGTPIVAYRSGSVPEVMHDGVTGFIVTNADEAVAAVERAVALDRRKCREVFDARFTAARMAADYVAVYERLVARRRATTNGVHQNELYRTEAFALNGAADSLPGRDLTVPWPAPPIIAAKNGSMEDGWK